jgi:hypothetical protein
LNIEPKLTTDVPVRWVGHVSLSAEEARAFLKSLPARMPLARELAEALGRAAERAAQLNGIDQGARL